MNYITDKEIDAIQGDMGETLRKQPRVRLRIEASGYWEGGINGWFFRVQMCLRDRSSTKSSRFCSL